MKKLLALLLALAMVACLFAGCAKEEEPTPSGDPVTSSDPSTDNPDQPTTTGSVYFLNFKPEADQAWQDLAKTYTEKTGVPVKVVTAASGKYSETLTAEMSKDSAPTLFQCGNMAGLETWQDYCLPLDGTDFLNEMTTADFNLVKDGVTYCAGYCYECYGIIVNTKLLAEAGYSVSDITNFETLKKVAEDITARKDELGFAAFTSSGMDGSSSWRFSGHLANLPLYYQGVDSNEVSTITADYIDNFKNVWDLYINNSTCAPTEIGPKTGDESEAEFGTGKAVFFQNGSWEYSNLVTSEDKGFLMNAEDLTMIPIYCGVEGEENAALCCGTENCWAVNAKASAEDQQATLDFLYWVVTSDEGTQMMAEQFGPIPFKNAKESENVFFNAANALFAEGKYNVAWAFNYTPNVDAWRQGVVDALMAYSTAGGSWDDVVTAFVDGWAAEWEAQNG